MNSDSHCKTQQQKTDCESDLCQHCSSEHEVKLLRCATWAWVWGERDSTRIRRDTVPTLQQVASIKVDFFEDNELSLDWGSHGVFREAPVFFVWDPWALLICPRHRRWAVKGRLFARLSQSCVDSWGVVPCGEGESEFFSMRVLWVPDSVPLRDFLPFFKSPAFLRQNWDESNPIWYYVSSPRCVRNIFSLKYVHLVTNVCREGHRVVVVCHHFHISYVLIL